MKRYQGKRTCGQAVVTVNDRALNPRFDLRMHSPSGFEWGYGGSGPAQLALALLADHLGNAAKALDLYQDFKFAVVVGLPRDGWVLSTEQIDQALAALKPGTPAAGVALKR